MNDQESPLPVAPAAEPERPQITLIVDDSARQRRLYAQFIERGGLGKAVEVESAVDAFRLLGLDLPDMIPEVDLIIMDVMMPEIDGLEATRRIKSAAHLRDLPVMIVTGAAEPEVLEAAFAAGASDYVVKPVMMVELLARARSLLRLKKEIDTRRSRELELEDTIAKLQEALVEVKRLSGLLPICAHCKKIRNDAGYWQQVEIYLGEHSDARFSHGICPDCLRQRHPQYADRVLERVRQKETG